MRYFSKKLPLSNPVVKNGFPTIAFLKKNSTFPGKHPLHNCFDTTATLRVPRFYKKTP